MLGSIIPARLIRAFGLIQPELESFICIVLERLSTNMGGHPYFYSVAYEADANSALQKLRQREFQAGRYNPAIMFPEFPVDESVEGDGPQHGSLEEAWAAAGADGTRSILDLMSVADEADFLVARRLRAEELMTFFGTDKPTEKDIQASFYELLDTIERGQGICFTVYDNDTPHELVFAGYSFD